jgi:transcription elongation factor Elf1
VTRIVCPHCGEWQRYELMSVTDRKTIYWCKPCDQLHEWERASVSEPWRVREEKE